MIKQVFSSFKKFNQIQKVQQFKFFNNNINYFKFSSLNKFTPQNLQESVAKYELDTLDLHKDNEKVQEVVYDLTYQLSQESKYDQLQQNLIIYLNLGDINLRFNKLDEAKQGLYDLLQFLEDYSEEKPDLKQTLVPQTLHRLAGIALKQKDIDLANDLYHQTVEFITEDAKSSGEGQAIGIDQVKLLSNTYEKIGNLKRIQQNYEKAVENYQKSHDINQQALPEKHPFTIKVQTFLGDTLRKIEQFDKAKVVLESVVPQIEIKDKNTASLYVIASSSLAMSHIGLKDYEKCIDFLEKVEQEFNKCKEQNLISDLNYANMYQMKASAYRGLEKNDEALKENQMALSIAEQVLPEDHQLLKQFKEFKV